MAEKAEIRYAVLVEGKSQRQVARESGYWGMTNLRAASRKVHINNRRQGNQ
jgi:hypothetical protein